MRRPIPCHNCLVLAMCRGKIKKNKHIVWGKWDAIKRLANKCPDLHEYILTEENFDYDIYHRRLAVHFLTGTDLGDTTSIKDVTLNEVYESCHMNKPIK